MVLSSLGEVENMQIILEAVVEKNMIDHLGHMNYLEYIIFSEKGMSAWFQKAGASQVNLAERHMGMVFVKLDVSYLNEARLGDTLKLITAPVYLGNKSFVIKQTIYNQNNVLITEFKKTFVMFNTDTRKSIPVIEEISRQFTDIQE
jgi:YbgC/YbaW family acyl-CoA thioester hydrolase